MYLLNQVNVLKVCMEESMSKTTPRKIMIKNIFLDGKILNGKTPVNKIMCS